MTTRHPDRPRLRPGRLEDSTPLNTKIRGAQSDEIDRVARESGLPRPEVVRRLLDDGIAVHDARRAAHRLVAGDGFTVETPEGARIHYPRAEQVLPGGHR